MEYDETFLYREIVPLIAEYDEIFKSIEKQNASYEAQHQSLQREIKALICENKNLSSKLEEALKFKDRTDINEDNKLFNDMINNLRDQIKVISQEKDRTYDLWQNSLMIIDHLETELKIYKDRNHEFVSKTELDKEKQKHALEIKELKKILNLKINKQDQKAKDIFKNIESRENQLEIALEGQRKALDQVQERTLELSELKQRLDNMHDTCKQLKEELDKREEVIQKLCIIDQDSKAKVLESILITEAALSEKEVAIRREIEAKNEIKEISDTLSEIMKEAEEKIKDEKEIIKQQYNEKLNKLIEEMKSVRNKLIEKEFQAEKLSREKKMLEEDISRMQQGNVNIDSNHTSKLLILEKNLESTFQKLLISERRLIQMTSERDNIRMDLEQMSETFDRDRRTIEVDKQNLERKIKTLQKELAISNGFVEDYVFQIKELNTKMIEMEQDMNDKISQKDKMFEKILYEKINHIKSKCMAIQTEMETHLKSEHNLNKRWKKETREILDKLQNKIQELKIENNNLREHIVKLSEVRTV